MQLNDALLAEAIALATAGRKGEAVLIVNQLAAAGDAGGLFTLADWRFRGELMPQDFVQARALFRRSGEAGHALGAVFHTNLLANGIGAPPDWPAALKRLRAEARQDPGRRRTFQLIEKMKLTPLGDPAAPPQGRRLAERPDATLFPRFFSPAECDYLRQLAEPDFRPSVVIDVKTGRDYLDPVRTSDGSTVHWLIEDPAVHALNRRIAAAAGSVVENGEPLQILRYSPGQQYRRHLDAVPGYENQRVATMLVYLNDGYEGGETSFVHTGLAVKGRKGDALLFRNVLEDGRPDPQSEHAGLPVTKGVKLLASRWIRERRHVP